MRRFLLVLATIGLFAEPAIVAGTAHAADHVSLYTDPSGSTCHLTAPGYTSDIYVLHGFIDNGTSGSRFRLNIDDAPGTAVLGFASSFSYTGDATSLITVNYGFCWTHQVVVGHFTAFAACGYLWLKGVNPLYPPEAFACDGAPNWTTSFPMPVCGGGLSPCNPSPAEASTWGSVKALYR